MSLSFVSKAIQTTAEDGTFEEHPVVNNDDHSIDRGRSNVTGGGMNGSLFDQIRQNQDDAEAEREEFQRSLMRGTLALDEDDAAHLDHLNQRRLEELKRKEEQTAIELASFRAAQADRQHHNHQEESTGPMQDVVMRSYSHKDAFDPQSSQQLAAVKFAPTFIKRKRKCVEENVSDKMPVGDVKNIRRKRKESLQTDSLEKVTTIENPVVTQSAIMSLLSGYGSSSDDDDDQRKVQN